ncbi:Nif3-like dinuclear metal center hexameric protein, partial [Acinetobacter baumannii]
LTAAHYAHEAGSQLLLTHHPLIFEPLSSVTTQDHVGKTVLFLARHGIAHIAAHTNWDSAPGGINDELAKILGLNGIASFGEAA